MDTLNEIEKNNEIKNKDSQLNSQRRQLFSLFGLVSAGSLSGCLSESTPTGKAEKNTGHSTSRVQGGGSLDPNCGCMPADPAPPVVANPPATGGGVVQPGPAPTNPAPAQPATPSSSTAAFASIGPGSANLTVANMGSIALSDGNAVNTWSFAAGGSGFNGNRVLPGPVVECVENQPMQLTLNTMMPHTIHLHGLDVDTLNDGVPSTSFYVGGGMMGGSLPSLAGYASVPSPFTYQFTPLFAGTYMYHCHVDTVLHMEMGMSGTIIVRPSDGSKTTVWSGGPEFEKEYIWQLHTMDSSWHSLTQSGAATARYRPDYFFINGLEGANLLTDLSTSVKATPGARILIRLVNLGYLPANVNLGGTSFDVVSSDGRPLLAPMTRVQIIVGPGERYDVMFNMPGRLTNATVSYSSITGATTLGTAATLIIPA